MLNLPLYYLLNMVGLPRVELGSDTYKVPALTVELQAVYLVPIVGLEPTSYKRWILSPLCLPFHHMGHYSAKTIHRRSFT